MKVLKLVEFLETVKGSSTQDIILSVLFFEHTYNKIKSLTVSELRDRLRSTRVPKSANLNISQVLINSGSLVDSIKESGSKFNWSLTDTGFDHVRHMHGLPDKSHQLVHEISTLSTIIRDIKDNDIKSYVEESVLCLSVGALRSSIVFLWSGAIRVVQKDLLNFGIAKLNSALLLHDPKSRTVKTLDHFAYIKDSLTLMVSQELGLFDKNEKGILEDALNLRNRCGHPSKYKPREKKISGFVEDITSIVFL